ncbi:MAG: sulfurtransferase TusA family protein [Congregibacter sp.]
MPGDDGEPGRGADEAVLRRAAEAAPASTVDARGHRCPMPLLMAKRGLNALEAGETLLLLSTDEGSVKDFEVFARQSGHELLETRNDAGEFHFLLCKR